LSLLTRNKGTFVVSLLLLIFCGQRTPLFHSVSTNGSHPLSPKEGPCLGNSTYTFTVLPDQKRGAQVLIYRVVFLKNQPSDACRENLNSMALPDCVQSLRSDSIVVVWARGRSWGRNQLPFRGSHQRHVPSGPWRDKAGSWWLWVDLPSCLIPTQWVMEDMSS